MNTTINAGEPPYTTTDAGDTEVNISDSLGFFFVVLFFFITLCYGAYLYKIRIRSPPPPSSTTIGLGSTTNHHHTDNGAIRFSQGLDEGVLMTFPTFVCSDAITDSNNSGCSICLAEYKPADMLRLLPECGHLFHVSCIDTWLKVHPTCPVCRNSPLSTV